MPQSTEITRWTFSAARRSSDAGCKAVPVPQAFRDEVDDVGAEQFQRAPKNHGRRDPVHVVVAVHGDAFALGNRREDAIDRDGMSVSAKGSSRSSSEGDRKRRAWSRSEIPRMHSNLAVTGAIPSSWTSASALASSHWRGCQSR